MKQVTIVCDGSSLGNGRQVARAGAAALLDYRDHRRLIGEYMGHGTNQQAEIVAACLGLESLKEPCEVLLISDSQYVIKTMSGYFKRKANLDFWTRLDNAAARHRVRWEWTRGHAGNVLQEKCDKAARLIAAEGSVDPAKLEEILVA